MKKLIFFVGALFFALECYPQLKEFSDTVYHFSFEYPEPWERTDGKNPTHVATIISEDKSVRLEVYGVFVEAGYVVIEKFADQDTAFFPMLGEIEETENILVVPYIGKYLAYLAEGADEVIEVRKKYLLNKNGEYALSYFAVDDHYAYALLAFSKSGKFEGVEDIFDSFQKTSTSWVRQENNQSSAHRGLVFNKYLTWVLIFIFFFLLMFAGRNFKKFGRQRNALLKFKAKQAEGYKPDRRWTYAYRRASRKLTIAIVLFVFLLVLGIFVNSSNWYIYVAIPGAFMLGYFGFTLVVDDPS